MDWRDGLRPYQVDGAEAVAQRRVSRAVVAVATGGGKTVMMARLPEVLATDRILIVVHRDKIAEQIKRAFEARGHLVGIERAELRAPPMARIVVASTQTLGARGARRAQALAARGFDVLIHDECQHAVAATHCRIQAALGLLREGSGERDPRTRRRLEPPWVKTDSPHIYHVGFSATPDGRGDGIGLHQVYDEIIFRKDLRTLIKEGWLVPIVPYAIHTATNLDEVGTLGRDGDYIDSELEAAINTKDRHDAILDGWRRATAGKLRTLGFAVTVAHAQALAAYFSAAGVQSWIIEGGMSSAEREDQYHRFEATPGGVMWNVSLVGEGVDLAHVECVLFARPTRSRMVLSQALGRGTRLAAGARDYAESVSLGKSYCLALDVSDSMATLGRHAVRIGELVGAPWPDLIVDGQDLLKQVEEQEDRRREEIRVRDRSASLRSVRLVDSGDLPRHFGLAWMQAGEDAYLLPVPDGGVLRLTTDMLDRWIVERGGGSEWHCLDAVPPDQAQVVVVRAAEAWYREAYGASTILLDRGASWRSRLPSEAQRWRARRVGVAVDDDDTAGTLSDRISAA